jgi:holo-ACP synthase
MDDILKARESRWHRRLELARLHGETVVTVTLNVPGADKNPPGAGEFLDRFMKRLAHKLAMAGAPMLHQETQSTADGPEGHLVVNAFALDVKRLCVDLEDESPGGRLADVDVMTSRGEQLGRTQLGLPPRACLVCEAPAMECIRTGRHDPQVVTRRVRALLAY